MPSITLFFPIGTTGLIDEESYDVSPFYDIPHSDEELAEISYIEACMRYDAELIHVNSDNSKR